MICKIQNPNICLIMDVTAKPLSDHGSIWEAQPHISLWSWMWKATCLFYHGCLWKPISVIKVYQVYTTKTVCNLDFMKTECEKIDESQWLASLPLKPKLRTYILYYKSFITEDYVTYCLNKRKRSSTAKIRIAILPLHIETGKFPNVKVEERVCQVCNNGDVENEYNFFCICKTQNSELSQS